MSRSSPGNLHGPGFARSPGTTPGGLSEVRRLSVTHERLDELHPADVAASTEGLDPSNANVFQHLDDARRHQAISRDGRAGPREAMPTGWGSSRPLTTPPRRPLLNDMV